MNEKLEYVAEHLKSKRLININKSTAEAQMEIHPFFMGPLFASVQALHMSQILSMTALHACVIAESFFQMAMTRANNSAFDFSG